MHKWLSSRCVHHRGWSQVLEIQGKEEEEPLRYCSWEVSTQTWAHSIWWYSMSDGFLLSTFVISLFYEIECQCTSLLYLWAPLCPWNLSWSGEGWTEPQRYKGKGLKCRAEFLFLSLFLKNLFILEMGRGGGRPRERIFKQNPHWPWSPMQARSHNRPWDHDLSWNQVLDV